MGFLESTWRTKTIGPFVVLIEVCPENGSMIWRERARIPVECARQVGFELIGRAVSLSHPLSHEAVAAMEAG